MMNSNEQGLDGFFQKARSQRPELSFEELSARFSASVATQGVGKPAKVVWQGLAGKFNLLVIGTLVIAGLVIVFNWNVVPEEAVESVSTELKVKEDKGPANAVKEELKVSPPVDEKTNDLKASSSPEPAAQTKEISTIEQEDSSKITTSQDIMVMVAPLPKRAAPVLLEPKAWQIFEPSEAVGREVAFTLTEHSSESNFWYIKREAEAVGIHFTFRVHHQKKRKTKETYLVRDFEIDMHIPGTDIKSRIEVFVPREGSFEVSLGWTLNEEGRAVALSESLKIDTTR